MQISRIVLNILSFLSFLMLFSTVFIVNNELANRTVSGKYFWFYASMGVLNIITFVFAYSRKLYFQVSIQDWLLLLFAGSVLFSSSVINDMPLYTTKFVLLALLVILYFNCRILFSVPLKEKRSQEEPTQALFFNALSLKNAGLVVIMITGLVEAIWGLRQLYGFIPSQHSLFSLTGSFFNPGPYAGYLAVVFPVSLYFAINAENKQHKIQVQKFTLYLLRGLGTVTCLAIVLVLPATMSRASWIAAIAGSMAVVYFSFYQRPVFKSFYRQNKKKICILTVSLSILITIAFTGMYLLKKDSADGRSLIWKISLQTVMKHPFGVGLGHFSGAYGEAQANYFASGKGTETEEHVAGGPEYGFNEYLQICVESGILSLVLFVGMVVWAVRSSIMNKRYAITASMLSLLSFACFSYPFNVLPFLIIFVFLMAAVNGTSQSKTEKRSVSIVITSLCLLLSCICLYKEYPVYQAYKKWNKEKMYTFDVGLFKDASVEYGKIYPLLNDQIQFLFEYAQSLSKSEQYMESNAVLKEAVKISCDPMLYNIMGKNYQALKEHNRAEECFRKASYIVPKRIYPFYLLTRLYHEMGQQDKVDEMAGIVQTKEPKVHTKAVEEMREEVEKLKTKQ